MHGRTIKILLEQGTAVGIRHAEVVNWTGQAVVCPRTRIPELRQWTTETECPGVYFLLGKDDESGRDLAYIGEAENVRGRMQDHLKSKEFWQEAILFTSKDLNLTKAHVKYLESRLMQRVHEARRVSLENGNSPALPQLPRSDKHAMEEFIDNVELLLGALGYRLLEHIEETIKKPDSAAANGDFRFSIGTASAVGAPSDDGFVVRAGSTAVGDAKPKCPPFIVNVRQQLLDEGVLAPHGELLRFSESFAFTSPSAAAATIAGSARNGRESWKLEDGRTLKQVEESESDVD